MYKHLLLIFLAVFYSFNSFACEYSIHMIDSYGDGWNGNSYEIFINGTSDGTTYTFTSGTLAIGEISFNPGDNVEIHFNDDGSFVSECSWEIYDYNGVQICSGDANSFTNPICSWTDAGPCPSCTDGIQNGSETGIDCGGTCGLCPTLGCSGGFYDTGGPGSSYGNGENGEWLFCSDDGQDLYMTFFAFDVESCCDHMYIYDGSDASAPLIGQYEGTALLNQTIISNNASNCLYFVFTSDGSVTYDGWEASYACGSAPPPPPPPAPTEEDCLGAISLCQDNYYNTSGTYGTGMYGNEINVGSSECLVQEFGGNWYTFTPESSGVLNFTITPDNAAGEDYDWALFDLTNGECSDLAVDPYSYVMSANAAGNDGSSPPVNWGPTGISSTNAVAGSSDCNGPGTGSWNTFNPDVNVTAGGTYVLYIAQFDGSQGYTVDFGSSMADLYDVTPPEIVSIDPPVCGATSITIHMSENIDCQSVDDGEFYLTGPGGSYTLSNITSPLCSGGAVYDNYLVANVSPAITSSGTFTIGLDANISGSIYDMCGNTAPSISFDFDIGTIEIDLSSDPAICGAADGSIDVSLTGAVDPIDYNWSVLSGGGTTEGNIDDQANPYTILNLQASVYEISITDASGCTASAEIEVETTGSIVADFSVSNDQCLEGNSFDFINNTISATTVTYSVTSPSMQTSVVNGTLDYTGFVADESGEWEVQQNVYFGTCLDSIILNFTVFEEPSLTETHTDILCNGLSTGEIIASAIIPGTYSMFSGGGSFTDSVASNLPAGNYSFVFVDNNGCNDTLNTELTEPLLLEGEISSVDALCSTPGVSTVIAQGGTTPYHYLWSDGQTTSIATGLVEGNYSCTITDDNGCSIVLNSVINNNLTLNSDIQIEHEISCFEGNDGAIIASPIGGDEPYLYEWSDNVGVSDSNPIHSNLSIGTYDVTIVDLNGCIAYNTISLTEPTEVIVQSFFDVPTCYGYSDGVAWVEASGGVSPYTYLWTNGSNSEQNLNIPAGNYTVSVTDANSCLKVIDGITISEPNEVILSLEYEPSICIGQSAEIRMSATSSPFSPYTFYWNNEETTDVITVYPSGTTTYYAQVIDAHGCESGIRDVTVTVNPPISFVAIPNKNSICKGEVLTISVQSSGGNGNYSYRLLDGTYLTVPIELNLEQTEDITIIAYDDCGSPEDTIIIPITVQNVIIPNVQASVKNGCAPLVVDFIQDVENQEEGTSYLWNFGDESSSNISLEALPSHSYMFDGTFQVSLQVTTPLGCVAEVFLNHYVNVFPKPIASFICSHENLTFVNPRVFFENNSEETDFVTWSFGDGDSSTVWSPEYIYNQIVSDYEVTLLAENSYGCLDTAVQFVSVKNELGIYIPTGFSPDFDGVNETFVVKGHGISEDDFTMLIYNRWGEEVFSSDNIHNGWDGKTKGNNLAQVGIYYYLIKFSDIYGIKYEKSGAINLIK